jgi:mono/diheme cytochrome c family protein
MMRGVFAWLVLSTCVTAAEPAALLRTHCITCHNGDQAEAELNLSQVVAQPRSLRSDFRLLTRILEAVSTEAMPPSDAERKLTSAEREQLKRWLQAEVAAVAVAQDGDPGLVVMPRLTKSEYRNVIRDLSDGVVRDGGHYLPQEGGAGEGFSNVGEAQGMNPAQFEKYVEAARQVLRHVRAYPNDGLQWSVVPQEPVDEPAAARKEATDEIIAWYVAQQQKWGAEHRDAVVARFGFGHAAYLEAAWRYRHRAASSRPAAALDDFARCDDVPLARVALEKWWKLLNDADSGSPFAEWATAWRSLPVPARLDDRELRSACTAIVTGRKDSVAAVQTTDYAPPYEISFHEAQEEVLAAATNEGRWPFRIDIGNAQELFLVVTDAGDGGRGEYAVWRRGRILFSDGTSKPWQDAVQLVGANSGRPFAWGVDGEGSKKLGPDCIGVQPPGALKFAVPAGAIVFEVDLTLDESRTKQASIQALVLKEKPKSQSYIPGRYVFGGRRRDADNKPDVNKNRERLLRLRNVAEANRTKIGLNAERNVFADWTRTGLEHLGGPWPDQDADREEPSAPYHYTVLQVRRNATPDDLAQLATLENRLSAIAQVPQQQLLALLKSAGIDEAKEGVLPPTNAVEKLSPSQHVEYRRLVETAERDKSSHETLVRNLLGKFAKLAWRRSLSDEELTTLVQLYRDARARGFSFDGAVKTPLMVVLTSPYFLYRGSIAGDDDVAQLSASPIVPLRGHELASRLSFFLWASVPDEALLRIAEGGTLHQPDVLRAQATRMLRDPRAASLAVDFAGQLWGFSDFETFNGPDADRFPEFTPELRRSMLSEVEAFLDDLFRSNRPLTALIDSDYTFANGLLAKHYGLLNAPPSETPQRVGLPPERGGLPGMAWFLTKTSVPLRTSPVQRGVWVAEQLLGRRVPPPPANAGQISADEQDASGLSIREQLARHRAAAGCAACHARIDPFGIALEGFDPIGRRRTTLREGDPIVDRETTHDGATLAGFVGLRRYLVEHRDEVLAHFNRKLLGYALGRAVIPGDTSLLERMNSGLPQHDYRFSFLVESIVASPQFLQRRVADDARTEHKD